MKKFPEMQELEKTFYKEMGFCLFDLTKPCVQICHDTNNWVILSNFLSDQTVFSVLGFDSFSNLKLGAKMFVSLITFYKDRHVSYLSPSLTEAYFPYYPRNFVINIRKDMH